MLVNLTVWFLIVIQVNCENTSIENEKVLLNQSLTTLRRDYNELLENVDKLVKEFAEKFGEAGNVAGFVPQITEQKFNALPSIETQPQSSKPVEPLETTLNHQTSLGYAENIDETSIKPQNKQITELTTDLNQIVDISNERKTSDSVEPLKANHENDYEGNGSKTEDKKDSFLSAKGPTKVHPLFTFQKGKSGQTIRMVENHFVRDNPDN